MGYSAAQLKRIMATRGQAYIAKDKLPYTARVCETYLRRKVYRLEDRASIAQYRLILRAYDDISLYALRRANTLGIEKLGADTATLEWRRSVLGNINERLAQLATDTAYSAFEYAAAAYRAGYYGRLWTLSQVAPNDWQPQVHWLSGQDIALRVLKPELMEAAQDFAYAAQGAEWREVYQNAMRTAQTRISRNLTASAIAEESIPTAIKEAIGAPLGITPKPTKQTSAAYHEMQLATRTAVIRANNHASTRAAKENSDYMLGVVWVTNRDAKVCPACQKQEGRIFILNDLFGMALFGLPPDGSHYGCRCTLIPVLLPGWGDNEPPEDSFDEWWDEWGFGDEMDMFFDDTELESSII